VHVLTFPTGMLSDLYHTLVPSVSRDLLSTPIQKRSAVVSNAAAAQPDLRPEVSMVVVVHDMGREAPRTLLSLSSTYQQHILANEYEVIVVDNGSTLPLDPHVVANLNGNFQLIRLDEAPPSPAHAINVGLAAARGNVIGVMIDGARLATPGLLHFGRAGTKLFPRAIVVSPGWHLGFDQQRWSIKAQYNRSREDTLLQSIRWPEDGYRLFEIAALDEPAVDCWFGHVYESNGFFLSREMWDLIGGFDERFDAPGGGLVNHDTLRRAFDVPGSELVVLLGEGTFHQLHGGIASNANSETFPASLAEWAAQYEAIRGKPYQVHTNTTRTYLGTLPPPALVHFARSIVEPVGPSPIGPDFDRTLWTLVPARRPADPTAAALVELAETELRARRFEASASVARIARSFAPDEPALQPLLAAVSPFARDRGEPAGPRRAGYHLARGKAFRILGDTGSADAEFRAALAIDAESEAAHELHELRGHGRIAPHESEGLDGAGRTSEPPQPALKDSATS
jgi:glycosyltransferase involved in cell wall biosynthesis